MLQKDSLVSCAWLAARLEAPDIKILDATSFLPTDPRDPYGNFLDCRIPNARFFDINEIADTSSSLSHAMPKPETFMAKVSRLGIGDGFKVVIYDANGGNNAAMRAWWMFRHFGHEDVAILDGGLPKWLAEGHRTADGEPFALKRRDYRYFTPRNGIGSVATQDHVLNASKTGNAVIVDARAPERFSGSVPEPRPCRNLGHVPGAVNLHHVRLFNDDMTIKTTQELKQIFDDANVPLDETPVIAMCGTGVTACAVIFAMTLLGKTDVALYDGSWEDWGNTSYLPFHGPAGS